MENNLKAYKLIKFKEEKRSKYAELTLSFRLNSDGSGLMSPFPIGSFYLDDEDIEYLLSKYKISELEQKEIECAEKIKELSDIQECIKLLKSHV